MSSPLKRRRLSTGFYIGLALLLAAIVSSVAFMGKSAKQGSPVESIKASDAPDDTNESLTADASSDSSEFNLAAAQNIKLKTDLEWTFGGKTQHGWYLYVPLIDELIGTYKDASSSEFARVLARWQKSNGLTPNGILDKDSLFQMISVWQSRRIKERAVPAPDKLFTAPISDFYDPTRAEELRKVEPQTYAAYKRMVAAAIADRSLGLNSTRAGELASSEQYLKIVSAFRSPEYQERLRQQSPNAGSAGLAKISPHFTGRALDVYVGGDPVSTEDNNRAIQTQIKVYKWLVRNAQKFGFYPYFYEPWHWEYRGQ